MSVLTSLAVVLQYVHGEESKKVAPAADRSITRVGPPAAVRALQTACHEVLASRAAGTGAVFTRRMAKEWVHKLTNMVVAHKLTYLEQAVCYVEYLEYLRTRRVGMDRDELATSLVVYNIAQAYKELREADIAEAPRYTRIGPIHHELLLQLA